MSQRAFNNCVLNGTTITIGEMVTGSGILDSVGYDDKVTTLNHCIHNVRLGQIHNAKFKLYGDREDLSTGDRDADVDNFGGTHTFKYDSTTIEEFDGLVTADYDDNERITNVSVRGEESG